MVILWTLLEWRLYWKLLRTVSFVLYIMRVYSHIKSFVLYQPDATFKLCPHSKSQRDVLNWRPGGREHSRPSWSGLPQRPNLSDITWDYWVFLKFAFCSRHLFQIPQLYFCIKLSNEFIPFMDMIEAEKCSQGNRNWGQIEPDPTPVGRPGVRHLNINLCMWKEPHSPFPSACKTRFMGDISHH